MRLACAGSTHECDFAQIFRIVVGRDAFGAPCKCRMLLKNATYHCINTARRGRRALHGFVHFVYSCFRQSNIAGPPKYTCYVSREAAGMAKKPKKEIDYDNIKIIHTFPETDDINREANKKRISNDLYEVFLRIQSQLHPDDEEV